MTVFFIGAGPGAPDLITLRGRDLIAAAPVCLYAGSLVPTEILAHAPDDATIIDTAPLHLDQIIAHMVAAHALGQDVSRVHSGDPSLYGAIGEQMRRLDVLDIPYQIIPGVPAFAAASAALKRELTLPGISQTVILTRTSVRASDMPADEELQELARSNATLAVHLSINNLANVVKDLTPHYGADCPVVVAYRVSWPDEQFIRGTLETIRAQVKGSGITRTALILVGPVLAEDLSTLDALEDSQLYDASHHHVLRPHSAKN
jgi:precorrin-4/cobalt-precorrin-4 C11-methyltransferase